MIKISNCSEDITHFITLLWKYDPPFQYCSDATIYLSDTALKMNILQHMVIYWILDECLQNQLWKKMKYPDTIELTHLHYNHEEYFTTKYDTICPKPRRVKRRLYLIYTIVNKQHCKQMTWLSVFFRKLSYPHIFGFDNFRTALSQPSPTGL